MNHANKDIANPRLPRITAIPIGDRNPPGYWTKEKTASQVKSFCDVFEEDLKERSLHILLQAHAPKLLGAVSMYGGLKLLNEEFRLNLILGRDRSLKSAAVVHKLIQSSKQKLSVKKKRLRWTKEEILQEYRSIYLRLGVFPSASILYKMGKSGLVVAALNQFGSVAVIKTLLSIPHCRPRKYWTLDNTVRELRQFISESPDNKENIVLKLRMQGRNNLARAIYVHGGLGKLDKKFSLNLGLRQRLWSKRLVSAELKALHGRGVLLTQAGLKAVGKAGLLGALQKFGGLNVFKEKMGLPIKRQAYWTDPRIVKKLRPIVASFGRIPSANVLKAMDENDLACAIKKRGGVKKYSNILNVPSTFYFKANDGHYLHSGYECLFDNILFKYNIAHRVHGKITPTSQYRYDFLIGDIYIEICGYDEKEHTAYFRSFSQKVKLYKKLRLKYVVIPKKFFKKKFSKIEKDVLDLISKFLPSGLPASTNVHNDIIPVNYWKSLKNIEKELRSLVEKYGRMPLDRELRQERKAPLVHGIYRYHGSIYEVGKKLKIIVKYKPKGFYTEENAVNEYTQLCIKHRRFLRLKDLQDMRYYGLAGYIAKNGGYNIIRKKTGLGY